MATFGSDVRHTDPLDAWKWDIEARMIEDSEERARRDAALIARGANPGDWVIEYEIPPLRAIYHAFASPEVSEEKIRGEFAEQRPEMRIRKMFKISAMEAERK